MMVKNLYFPLSPIIDLRNYLNIFEGNKSLFNRKDEFKKIIVKWEGREVNRNKNFITIELKTFGVFEKFFYSIAASVKNNDVLKEYESSEENRYWYLELDELNISLLYPKNLENNKDVIIDYGITPSIYYNRYIKYIEDAKKNFMKIEEYYWRYINNTYFQKIFLVYCRFFIICVLE
jgi:hypothetical protein